MIVVVVILASVLTYTYVLYFEPRTSCSILEGQSGKAYWTLTNATSPGDAQRSCYQFEDSGHGALTFAANPSPVDITQSNGYLNSEFCHPFLGIGNCPQGGMATLVIAWNSTSGAYHFNYTADAYGENGIAFGFLWENHTAPLPNERVSFTLTYGP